VNDPCPAGWRVPTITELKNLSKNKSAVTTVNGLKGYYLSGSVAYSSSVPSVFFYATGRRNEGNVMENRNVRGYYWSSTRWNSNNRPNYMTFNTNTDLFEYNTSYYCMSVSVRCVHD